MQRKAAALSGAPLPPKHVRMMDVMFEAIEVRPGADFAIVPEMFSACFMYLLISFFSKDLHFLSHCGAALAVIACSHYSTFAAMLSWARTGGATAANNRISFLDMPFIAEGELQV